MEAAGYGFGAGLIKLPYARKLPIDLVTSLLRARMAQVESSS